MIKSKCPKCRVTWYIDSSHGVEELLHCPYCCTAFWVQIEVKYREAIPIEIKIRSKRDGSK